MGVRADDHVPCHGKPFFRQERMLDAHLSHLEIVRYLIFPGKLSDAFAVLRRLDILIGHEMIRHQSNLVFVEHALILKLFHFLDGHGAGNVIAQHQIQLRLDQLSCLHLVKPCRRGKDLLCHRHSHMLIPPCPFNAHIP